MGIFGPKGARLVFSCVSAVGATKFAPQADWDLQHSADALVVNELRSNRLAPTASASETLESPAMKVKSKKHPNNIQVPIFYATNREALSPAERQKHPRKFFGQVKNTTPGLNLGLARVRIKEDAFKLANLQDERGARRLEEIAPCEDEAEWKKKLRKAIEGDVKKSITVFVHGCFTDFPRGLEYGGLVKHGCNFSGPLVVFSWPSIGHRVQNRPYARDEKSVNWTVPHLKEFLLMLLTEFEAKVHVLSYSMGARAVIGALDLLEEEVLAIDEKWKKEGGQLTAALQKKLKHVVSRGEAAAAGMKVGVRELGDILVRERDMLVRERNPVRGRTASLPSSSPTQRERSNLSEGEPNGNPGYQEGQEESLGFDRKARSGDHELVLPQEEVAEKAGLGWSVSGEGRDLTRESGVGGEVGGGVSEGVSEAGLRRREALRSKLGHLIFMAPDEDVERFRHTARQWTRGLRNRVSSQTPDRQTPRSLDGDQAPGLECPRIAESDHKPPVSETSQTRPLGSSGRVKEEVRRALETEGPEAMQEAAKRGAKRLNEPENSEDAQAHDFGILETLSSLPSRSGFLVESKRSVDDATQPAPSPPLVLPQAVVTPRFSSWQATLSGGINSIRPLEPLGTAESEHKAPGGLEMVCPPSGNPLDTIFSGKTLDLNPGPFAKPHSQDPDTSNPQTSICLKPSLPRAQSTPIVLPTDASTPFDDDVIPRLDGVNPPGLRGKASSDVPTSSSGSVRATLPSSSASSQSPSRSSSSTDLLGEELQQALFWEHLQASGSDGYSDQSSEASSRAPSRTPSLVDLTGGSSSFSGICPFSDNREGLALAAVTAGGRAVTAVAGSCTAGTGRLPPATESMTAGRGDGGSLWRIRSLPALEFHLSSSVPVLSSAPLFLNRRYLEPDLQSLIPTSQQLSESTATEPSSPGPCFDPTGPPFEPLDNNNGSVTGPRFSLYTSQSDWALKLAGLATTKPWARGLARVVAFGDPGKSDLGRRVGATLVVEEGYETVDATEVSIGSRNMGHHYLFHRCILEDITHLLSGANAHARRFEVTTPDGKVYWKIERGDFKPMQATIPALMPAWVAANFETSKVAPAEGNLLYFASDEVAINLNY